MLPWFGLAVVFSLLLRLPFLNVGMISDEGGYAYVTQRWLAGQGTLYDDIWVSRPQGIFIAYGAIMETIGGSVAALRFGAWLFVAATLPAVYAFTRIYAGRQAALLAMFLFGVISASPAIEGFTANAEVFMALPCALVAWLLLLAHQRRWPAWTLLLIGVLCSFATLLKPAGIVMIPVALLFTWLAGNGGLRTALQRSAIIMAGVVIGVLPALVHGWIVGWDNFVFASVTYRIEFQSSMTVTFRRHLASIWGLFKQISHIAIGVGLLWVLRQRLGTQRPPVLAVSGGSHLAGDLGLIERARIMTRRQPAPVLLGLWIVASIGGIGMGGDWWYHYLIQMAAPFSIWLAPQLIDVGQQLRGFARYAFVIAVCAVMLYPFSVAARGDANSITAGIYPQQGYERQGDVGEYLRTNGTPGAPMLVAFDQAAIYYLADRPAAYRYMYEQELSAIPDAENDLVAIVSGPNRPEYVVDTGEPAPFPDGGAAFWVAVHQHYHIEAVINGYKIYRAN
jgi:4-amino-4-deoxy-L-arabinose transferase-like glycosyltransferase